MISIRRYLRALVVCQIALFAVIQSSARERGPRVDVACPSPPIPVTLGKNQLLVYELHITNFDTVPLTIKRVEVSNGDKSLVSFEDQKLAAATIRVGVPMTKSENPQDSRIIAPGARNVIFMWIEIPASSAAPAAVKHRIIFSSTPAGTQNPIDATLEDFEVLTSHDEVPVLSPPFNGGIWVAGDGPDNSANHRRSIFAIDGHIYSPERFAIDWVKVGPNGDSHHDGSSKNENSWDWGEPILAVADGQIVEAIDGFADNTPHVLPAVTLNNILGNHIILQIAPNRYVTYAHLQKGSLKVQAGARVHRGDVLGLLGNSGNSTGPHLHMQVTDGALPLQSQGVPFIFADFTYLGPGADYPEKQVSEKWLNSIPPGDGVLRFEPVKK
jgi:murein DD-endopeptidase